MRPLSAALALVAALAVPARPAGSEHFGVTAAFVARPGADGAIAVTFSEKDPDVHVNQEPAPRLKLDPSQAVLIGKQPPPPSRVTPFDPATAKYLDPKVPVRFPAALAPGAPKGPHTVKAVVTYFYCSEREGWCRKGSAEVEVPVTVP